MYWNNQFTTYNIGSAVSAATLTSTYADNTFTADVRGYQNAVLYVEYTPGENDSDMFIQIEAGPDAVNLFPKVALLDEDSSGTSTGKQHIFKIEAVTSGVAVKRRIEVNLADVKMRVSVKETTSGTFGTVKVLLGRNEQLSN